MPSPQNDKFGFAKMQAKLDRELRRGADGEDPFRVGSSPAEDNELASASLANESQAQERDVSQVVDREVDLRVGNLRERSEVELKAKVEAASRLAKEGDHITKSENLPSTPEIAIAKEIGHAHRMHRLEDLALDAWRRRVHPISGIFGSGVGYNEPRDDRDQNKQGGIYGPTGDAWSDPLALAHSSFAVTPLNVGSSRVQDISRQSSETVVLRQRVWQQTNLEDGKVSASDAPALSLVGHDFGASMDFRASPDLISHAAFNAKARFGEQGAQVVNLLLPTELEALEQGNFRDLRSIDPHAFANYSDAQAVSAIRKELFARRQAKQIGVVALSGAPHSIMATAA